MHHTFDFKNYMTLSEYDAKTSPNDLKMYNIITRMLIPNKLKQKISSLQGISQLRKRYFHYCAKRGIMEN